MISPASRFPDASKCLSPALSTLPMLEDCAAGPSSVHGSAEHCFSCLLHTCKDDFQTACSLSSVPKLAAAHRVLIGLAMRWCRPRRCCHRTTALKSMAGCCQRHSTPVAGLDRTASQPPRQADAWLATVKLSCAGACVVDSCCNHWHVGQLCGQHSIARVRIFTLLIGTTASSGGVPSQEY